jgi:hypothetical protein
MATKPYSIAVTPESSRHNAEKSARISAPRPRSGRDRRSLDA